MLTILLVALAFFLVVRRLQRRDPTPALYNYRDATKNEIGEYDAKQRHWETEPKAEIKIKVAKEGHAASPPVTCMEVFKKAVERHGNSDALAIERGGEGKWLRWTWKSYYEDTMAAARAFIALGVERFGCVNVIGFNSPEWFISNMGAIACGAKVAGIYTTNQPDACQYITEHSEAAVVVVENEAQMAKFLQIKNKLPKLRALVQWDGKMPDSSAQQGKVKVLDWASFIKLGRDEVKLQSEVEDRIAQTRPGHCSTLIYTSGTTGNPKAVMISHDNVTWTAKISLLTIDIVGTEQRSISYLPLSHIAAQMLDIHVPMAFAAHTDSNLCVYFARPDALKGSLGVTIKAVRPTQFFGVPRVWEKMEEKMRAVGASTKGIKKKMATWAKEVGVNGYKAGEVGASGLLPPMYSLAHKLVLSKIHDALGFDKCTCFFVGAAPTAKETFLYFGALGIPICELYGMSECTGPQTVSRVNYRKLGSCGASIPGTQLKLDHVDGRDKPGEGEICYRGRHIMMGYMKEPGKTQDAIDNEGWLHSGDVGRIDSNGLLYITGRIKELLITAGGENIAPVPVEETLRKELPGISNCMLVGDRRKFNSMLVTLRTEPDLDTGGFKDNLVGEAANVSASKTIQQALKDPAWQKYVQAGVDRTNKQATSRACYIQKFAILPIDFSVPGGELTATLKLKRAAVCEKYKDLIESMYAGSAE